MACCGPLPVRKRNKFLLYLGGVITQIYRLVSRWLVVVLYNRMLFSTVSARIEAASEFWRAFFLINVSFETVIIIMIAVIGFGSAFHVLWKYAIKKRAGKLIKNLRFRLQTLYSKPFLTEDDSGQQEEISKILEDLPKVEEYEENIRFYLFSERFYIAMAVVFFFVISWKLALLACGLVAFVWAVDSIFVRFYLKNDSAAKEKVKKGVRDDQLNCFKLRELTIISSTQEKERERLKDELKTLDKTVVSFHRRHTPFQFFKFYFLSMVGSILVIFTYYHDTSIDAVFATQICVSFLYEMRSSLIAIEFMRPVKLGAKASVHKCEDILEAEELERREGESCCCWGGRAQREESEEVVVEMGVMASSDEDSEEGTSDNSIAFNKSLGLRDAELSYLTEEGTNHVVQTNFNLEIQKGEIVGLVGEEGCGKSTIMKHLMGLMAPAKGNLVVDGEEISQKNIGNYLSKTAAVFQFSDLFHRTIAENVAYGSDVMEGNRELVETSLKKAQIWDAVMSLDDETDHVLDEGEDTFSPGQKQRLQLARMFAMGGNKEIIFIDEPTSSMDPTLMEKLIPEFQQFLKGKTCVIISHDLAFLNEICTRIVQVERIRDHEIPLPVPPVTRNTLFSILSYHDPFRDERNNATYLL